MLHKNNENTYLVQYSGFIFSVWEKENLYSILQCLQSNQNALSYSIAILNILSLINGGALMKHCS